MKQLLFILLSILITDCTFAQGVTKNGKITSNGSEYVNKNGAIATSSKKNIIGDFQNALYWSSSQITYEVSNWEIGRQFSNGYQMNGPKNDLYNVRAIRTF